VAGKGACFWRSAARGAGKLLKILLGRLCGPGGSLFTLHPKLRTDRWESERSLPATRSFPLGSRRFPDDTHNGSRKQSEQEEERYFGMLHFSVK
jgi:hypothetical protein